ncbi:hypothetical protein R3P38DRAFT_3494732 [Favolaschia claudopus]|uniref:C2H2-type domain-containing protein n=1 Tax=Favolaschia claudopus TaxID=2862362 RepID=A0AAV9Z7B0_9AGAR
MTLHTCQYCGKSCDTAQGLKGHYDLTKLCRERMYKAYEVDSGGESESDDTVSGSGDSEVEIDDGGLGDDSTAPDIEQSFDDAGNSSDDDELRADPPRTNTSPSRSPSPVDAHPSGPQKRPRPTVEEVEDEDDRYVQDFPANRRAGEPLGQCETVFEKLRAEQKENGHPPWYPFESEEEWELARWLMTTGLSQKNRDDYLKLKTVREKIQPSFSNNRAFLKYIDALPSGPQWFCHALEVTGDEKDEKGEDKKEIVEVWYRDPVECVRELLGNPSFAGKQGYKPIRIFKTMKDGKYTNQEFSEMWTADWWWKIQELLPPGATLGPIIISTDKTQLTRFSGDQQAWPVYLTIGSIEKETRRSPSSRATILIGYIPVTKLEIISKARRGAVGQQLFHDCMRVILEPLCAAGEEGVEMACADGFVRRMYLILAAYIADYPEQCLVACCRENSCPRCIVKPKERGKPIFSTYRDSEETLRVIRDQSQNKFPVKFVDQNLRALHPLWADFPHCDIFASFTPDLLHELHNGVFGDHIVKWSTKATNVGSRIVKDTIRAVRGEPMKMTSKGVQPAKEGRFDTVLVRKDPPDRSKNPTDGKSFI